MAAEDGVMGVDAETHGNNRLIHSAVESEFIIIGEALRVMSQPPPDGNPDDHGHDQSP